MISFKLDDIPQLVENKTFTLQKACIEIYMILYTNPARFNLQDLSADDRSDFLLNFLEKKLETVLKNYNPKIAPFGAYLFYILQQAKIGYLKKVTRKVHNNELYLQDSIRIYEDDLAHQIENIAEVAQTSPKYVPQKREEEIPHLVYKKLFQKVPHRLTLAESQSRKIRQGILVLALKSAWYINDDQINAVSSICKISPEVITDSICKLKANLINKALSRKVIEENRNRAYCFINHYKIQLSKIENKNDPVFYQINKRLDFQIKNLENKNKTLQNGYNKIAPTNVEISRILGLTPRFISTYITRFKALDFSKIDFAKLSNQQNDE